MKTLIRKALPAKTAELIDFDGTLIVVSHDRDFLNDLVKKVYEFGNRKVTEHLEDIYGFLEKKKMESLRKIERKVEPPVCIR